MFNAIYRNFSKESLVKSLRDYGYSNSKAKYIANHANIDWFEQAEKKAKECFKNDNNLAFEVLIEILEGCHGFTYNEALYGADEAFKSR